MSPIDIFTKPPDVWPEAFRQPAPSRSAYRRPDLFETIDGWIRQVLFRRIPMDSLDGILTDLMIEAGENKDYLAQTYARQARDILMLGDREELATFRTKILERRSQYHGTN